MASSDEYQQVQFWKKPKKKTFCQEVQEAFLKQVQKDVEKILYPKNDKTI